MEANLQKLRSRGGVVIVEDGGTEITTYGLEKYHRH
jgi:hypothetical protein